MPAPTNSTVVAKIKKLAAAGLTLPEIGKKVGLTKGGVSRILAGKRRAQPEKPKEPEKPKRPPHRPVSADRPKKAKRIRKLYDSGHTYDTIVEMLGVSKRDVARAIREEI